LRRIDHQQHAAFAAFGRELRNGEAKARRERHGRDGNDAARRINRFENARDRNGASALRHVLDPDSKLSADPVPGIDVGRVLKLLTQDDAVARAPVERRGERGDAVSDVAGIGDGFGRAADQASQQRTRPLHLPEESRFVDRALARVFEVAFERRAARAEHETARRHVAIRPAVGARELGTDRGKALLLLGHGAGSPGKNGTP